MPSHAVTSVLLLGACSIAAAAAAVDANAPVEPIENSHRVRGSEGQRRLLGAPQNDNCIDAEAVPSLPYQSIGTTNGALPDFDTASCGADATANGVWYNYTSEEHVALKASVDNGLGVRVYSGSAGAPCAAFVCHANFGGEVEFEGLANVEYRLLVSNQTFVPGSSFTFVLEEGVPSPTGGPTTNAPSPVYVSYDDDEVSTPSSSPEPSTPPPSPTVGASPVLRYAGNYRAPRADTPIPTYQSSDMSMGTKSSKSSCKASKSSTKASSAKAFKSKKGSSMSYSKSDKGSMDYYDDDMYDMSYGAKSDKGTSMSMHSKSGKCTDEEFDWGDPMGKSSKGSSTKAGKDVKGKTGKGGSGQDGELLGFSHLVRVKDLNGAGRWHCTGALVVTLVWTLGLAVWTGFSP